VFAWAAVSRSGRADRLDVADRDLQLAYQGYYDDCRTSRPPADKGSAPASCPTILPPPEVLARDLDRIAILRNQGEWERALEASRQLLSRLENDGRNPVVLALRGVAR
jgi:hypothetical protein